MALRAEKIYENLVLLSAVGLNKRIFFWSETLFIAFEIRPATLITQQREKPRSLYQVNYDSPCYSYAQSNQAFTQHKQEIF